MTKLFGDMKVTPADAQLVDLHGTVMKNAIQGSMQGATDFWNQKAQEWVKEAKADPQIGGNRFETSIKRARAVWTEVLPNEADRTRLFNDFNDTKMGDHPILAKAVSEMGRRLEQVLAVTGTASWADAMKKLREPGAPPPGNSRSCAVDPIEPPTADSAGGQPLIKEHPCGNWPIYDAGRPRPPHRPGWEAADHRGTAFLQATRFTTTSCGRKAIPTPGTCTPCARPSRRAGGASSARVCRAASPPPPRAAPTAEIWK